MNGVFIIPTGIGCEIGGHAGDATPAARLIASVCDKLIIHPNVVNASDINEMTENMLYVEGSMLDNFLEGTINLKEIHSNKILVAVNAPVKPETINAVSACRATLGIDASIMELNTPFEMSGWVNESGKATGTYSGGDELIDQVKKYQFDALAVASEIKIEKGVALKYFKKGGVNPWGGIEAIVSKRISYRLGKPVAHAPVESEDTKNNEELFKICYEKVVDPRMAAEAISSTYFNCVLKGLHKAPRIGNGLSVCDIDFMISPIDVSGRPHIACFRKGIPIIYVEENKTVLCDEMIGKKIFAKNYIEAAGIICAMKAGVTLSSVGRPLFGTQVTGL